jgi:hypothetical protein
MKKLLCWLNTVLLSACLWLLPWQSAEAQTPTPSAAPRSFLFLLCTPEGASLRLNISPDRSSGLNLQGYGSVNDAVFNISGRVTNLIERDGNLSIPASPPPRQATQPIISFRSLEAASRGQSRDLGQLAIKDIRAYPQQDTNSVSGRYAVSVILENPLSLPQVTFPEVLSNCIVANLSTVRRSLTAPNRAFYTCQCANLSLPRELSAEPSSSAAFTDWSDRTGERCRINTRIEGTLGCRRSPQS